MLLALSGYQLDFRLGRGGRLGCRNLLLMDVIRLYVTRNRIVGDCNTHHRDMHIRAGLQVSSEE